MDRIDLYFEYIHPSFPILHKATFLSTLLLPPALRPQTTIILRSIIVAVAPLVRFHHRLRSHALALHTMYSSGGPFHQQIIDHALEQPGLKSLQALAILAFSYLGSERNGRVFGLVAILSRIATQISLHLIDAPQYVNTQSGRHATPAELEERRRCFWGIYILDQYASASTGSAPHFSQPNIRVSLPGPEIDFQLSPQETSQEKRSLWSYCIESAGALGRVIEWLNGHQQLNKRDSTGFVLAREIEDWWKTLPDNMRAPENVNKSDVGSLVLLHTTYNTYASPISFH